MSAEIERVVEAWQGALSGLCNSEAADCIRLLCSRNLAAVVQARALREARVSATVPAGLKLSNIVSSLACKDADERLSSDEILKFLDELKAVYASIAETYQRIVWLDTRINDTIRSLPESDGSNRLRACPSDGKLSVRFVMSFRSHLKTAATDSIAIILHKVLRNSFDSFRSSEGEDDPHTKHGRSRAMYAQLTGLGFSSSLQEALDWLLFQEIDRCVSDGIKLSTTDSIVADLRTWLDDAVKPWLAMVLAAGKHEDALQFDFSASVNDDTGQVVAQSANNSITKRSLSLDQWQKRLAFHLHEKLAMSLIAQLLHLISSFPRSLRALQDLKECLALTEKRPTLIRSLRQQFEAELLHAGVSTADILVQYVNMIRALQYLDPSGVILENVSEPVRDCLRRRTDTVRCIVSEITGGGDLFDELERSSSRLSRHGRNLLDGVGSENTDAEGLLVINNLIKNALSDAGPSTSSLMILFEDEDGESDAGDDSEAASVDSSEFEQWEPEPADAPIGSGKWRRGSDAVETLVAIYGSSDQIVNEYKTMLADKLIGSLDVDLKREGRILYMLQQRFGLDAMVDCIVMLKDLQDSRFSLRNAKAESPTVAKHLVNFQPAIISKEFWPKLSEEPAFKLPPEMTACMDQFTASYERDKLPRKLAWQHGLGVAGVNVTFNDGRKLHLVLTPFQLAILLRFTEKPRWTVEELKEDLKVSDVGALRRRLVFLANHDVIRATDAHASTYEAIEDSESMDSGAGIAEEETENVLGGSEDSEDDDDGADRGMAVFESYIVAMLKNLKALPLERVHTMLQMVVKTPVYDKTQEQLAAFLGQLVASEKLDLVSGLYSVRG